eukprot:7957073-Pyramimonas_sp.AAC.1
MSLCAGQVPTLSEAWRSLPRLGNDVVLRARMAFCRSPISRGLQPPAWPLPSTRQRGPRWRECEDTITCEASAMMCLAGVPPERWKPRGELHWFGGSTVSRCLRSLRAPRSLARGAQAAFPAETTGP